MTEIDVQIRPAKATDLEQIASLHRADRARRRLISSLIDDASCLVAYESVDVVGFAAVRRGRFFDRDFLELLLVRGDRRRQGIGAALLRAVVAAGGTSVVFTSTNESNAPMLALLRREGWEPSGRVTGLDEGDPELLFRIRR